MRHPDMETSRFNAYGPPETDPGPQPVTVQELAELVGYIQLLWTTRSDAIRDKSDDMILTSSKELLRTYEELAKLDGLLGDESAFWHGTFEDPGAFAASQTLEAAREELAFIPMASRILNLRNNQ